MDNLYRKIKDLGNTTTDLQIAEDQSHGFFNSDPGGL